MSRLYHDPPRLRRRVLQAIEAHKIYVRDELPHLTTGQVAVEAERRVREADPKAWEIAFAPSRAKRKRGGA